jgi:hypothetical protein
MVKSPAITLPLNEKEREEVNQNIAWRKSRLALRTLSMIDYFVQLIHEDTAYRMKE